MARLITRILEKTEPEAQRLTVLNVAGRGEPLTFERCIEIAQAKLCAPAGQAGVQDGAENLVAVGDCGDPARGRALHDGRIHHEYRSPAEVSGREL